MGLEAGRPLMTLLTVGRQPTYIHVQAVSMLGRGAHVKVVRAILEVYRGCMDKGMTYGSAYSQIVMT